VRWIVLVFGTTVVLSGCHLALPLESGSEDGPRPDAAVADQATFLDAVRDASPDRSMVDQATKDVTVPDEALPDLARVDQAAPDQAAPDQAAPDQAAPDQAVPDQAVPDQTLPDKAVPDLGLPVTYPYNSGYAVCTSPKNLSTTTCEKDTGTGLMTVDLLDDTKQIPYYIYLTFELDAQIAGKSCTKATVTLTVADQGNAKADQSGELWQVDVFDASTLAGGLPTKIKILGADKGPVQLSQPVSWDIPTSLLSAGTVYLGVFPTTNDGVEYWNSSPSAKTPPVLEVTCQ
jgi:hypothetical protein